jgi:hypothetical protein
MHGLSIILYIARNDRQKSEPSSPVSRLMDERRKRMNRKLALFFIVLLLVLSGCAAARTSEQAPSPAEAPAGAPAAMPDYGQSGVDFEAPVAQESSGRGEAAQVERLVIRNATLSIVVADPGESMSAVARMAEEMGGYVVTSNLYKTYKENGAEYPEATISVRVPAEQLNDAMDRIKGMVADPDTDILVDNVTGQDITREYTDLKSRLRNLEETERQLREIMASATKTEDVLAVHNQLTQIREQIEVLQGQIQYYEESAALSSISVTLQALEAVQPLEIGGWQPVGTARDAVQALIDSLKVLGNVTIWLLLFALPVGLVIFLPLRLLWWLYQRVRKNGKRLPSTPPPSANPNS